MDEVTPAHAAALSATFIDVRTPEEHAECHIRGDILMSIHSPRFHELIRSLDSGKEYIVYCRSGARSRVAGREMERIGLSVRNLSGGINAWLSSGLSCE